MVGNILRLFIKSIYFLEFSTDIFFAFNLCPDILWAPNEFLFELDLKIIFRSFPDIKSAISLGNDIRFLSSKTNFLIQVGITIVLPYSSEPFSFRRASIAEFISSKTIKACPRILIFLLATIY
jgi:hypothetical protein